MNRIVLIIAAGVSALAVVSSAQAADLMIQQPAFSGPGFVQSGGGNWDGLYLGVFGGYAAGDITTGADEDGIGGWLLGVNAGVNFTLTPGIVAGVVGDVAFSGVTSSEDTFDVDWLASVRGRLGYDAGPFMPYLTAGLAVAHADLASGADNVHFGWTGGVGVEVAATDSLSLDLQYRYSDYGTESYTLPDETSLTTHQVSLGVNWGF